MPYVSGRVVRVLHVRLQPDVFQSRAGTVIEELASLEAMASVQLKLQYATAARMHQLRWKLQRQPTRKPLRSGLCFVSIALCSSLFRQPC